MYLYSVYQGHGHSHFIYTYDTLKAYRFDSLEHARETIGRTEWYSTITVKELKITLELKEVR